MALPLDQIEQLEAMSGVSIRSMLTDWHRAEDLLKIGDSKERYAALLILTHQFPSSSEIKSLVERAATYDSNEVVRSVAISCLGSCFARTQDLRIGVLLARMVRKDTETDRIRR